MGYALPDAAAERDAALASLRQNQSGRGFSTNATVSDPLRPSPRDIAKHLILKRGKTFLASPGEVDAETLDLSDVVRQISRQPEPTRWLYANAELVRERYSAATSGRTVAADATLDQKLAQEIVAVLNA
jgi:hypothetical protein